MLKYIGLLWMVFITNVFANDALFLQEAIQSREGQFTPKTISFTQNHHLVFFFASTCPHCHNFSPILKNWVDNHHYQVDSYSFDGQALPEFQQVFTPDNQLLQAAFQNETIRYPALFVVNVDTANLYPVAIGELNAQELEERMQILIPKIMAFERGVA